MHTENKQNFMNFLTKNYISHTKYSRFYMDFAFLHKVFVDQAYRGKGLGSELFDVVLAECDVHGVDCFLTVDPVNEGAVRLYEKWGFTERKFVQGYYRPEEDRYVLTRHSRSKKKE